MNKEDERKTLPPWDLLHRVGVNKLSDRIDGVGLKKHTVNDLINGGGVY